MTYIKINDVQYTATVSGVLGDRTWNGRDTKSITLEMTHEAANTLFVDDLAWSIVYQADSYVDAVTKETVVPEPVEYDNSEYCVAGPITDNRDGTVTVKMGKRTDGEMLAELMEVLSND